MKNKNILLLFWALVMLAGTSCNKYLDINKSPLTATEIEPKLLFGYAITAWDVNKNSGDAWIPLSFMAQNLASGNDLDWFGGNSYDLSPNTLGNTWKVYYSTAGNNLKLAIRAAEGAEPANNNAAAQCKIVLAQLVYEATTLYGDVPFSEAWDPEKNPYPHYQPQKEVLEGVIKLLDEAMAQIDEASPLKISDYDVFYKGDLTKWRKLANSIKFKTLMVMVDKDPSKASAIGELLNNPSSMMSSAADNWVYSYYTASNQENPKFRLFKTYTNETNTFLYAHKNVYDFMAPKNDPRIPRYFKTGADGQYHALASDEPYNANSSLISDYLYRKDAPSVITSYQEIALLKAEAYARGLGVARDLAKAQDLYRAGVEASMKFYQADNGAIAEYVSDPARLVPLTIATDPVKEIHIQQWLDLMDRPMEAFVQWRRSGPEGSEVPALTVPPRATQGPLIRRFPLSPDESAANPNIPNPQPKYYDKMWFDL
ncbi:SusD/RagB family nutrient-binding outer membrane lipoprotein [Arcticibacter sp. MXS-1]|uniref:SusD/RagB family nutrient-binding outer membrane lipoprotein n=1 Tax=Arcticibacter sp. MXS-1 TaxID=3341726 RepID=UPI0035A854D1